jgi:hypothetical protein
MAALLVGAAAYGATTWLDNKLDGALHEAFGNAVETVLNMDPGQADPYFGGDGFTVNDTAMMSDICSNWEDFWDDDPVNLIGLPQQQPVLV